MSFDEKTARDVTIEGSTPVSRVPSSHSSQTHVQPGLDSKASPKEATPPLPSQAYPPGHGESALPEDKEAEAIENLEEEWESDPENARNWSTGRKWTAVAIVRARLGFSYGHSLIVSIRCLRIRSFRHWHRR